MGFNLQEGRVNNWVRSVRRERVNNRFRSVREGSEQWAFNCKRGE